VSEAESDVQIQEPWRRMRGVALSHEFVVESFRGDNSLDRVVTRVVLHSRQHHLQELEGQYQQYCSYLGRGRWVVPEAATVRFAAPESGTTCLVIQQHPLVHQAPNRVVNSLLAAFCMLQPLHKVTAVR
jgi:hypothetical protein